MRAVSSQIDVTPPYRLDLTVDALRRLAANVVDTYDGGVYRRVLSDARGSNLIAVEQVSKRELAVRLHGPRATRWLPVLRRMLGTDVSLEEWYKRIRPFPWLRRLAGDLRGLRPPRYPSLWEALANAIVFQQISIHAAASIMRRVVERFGEPHSTPIGRMYAFPPAHELLRASDAELRAAGLSANKAAHLRSASSAVMERTIDERTMEALPTADAAKILTGVRGIGPWSAAVVLLRGLGRLDAFPLKDSGVSRSLQILSGDPQLDAAALLEALGPVRGMLYFHLLLGRLRATAAARKRL